MSRIIFLLTATLLLGTATTYAQSKEEKKKQKALEKEWKKKLKALSPMDYKALVEEKQELAAAKSECESEKSSLEGEVSSLKTEVAELETEVEDWKATARQKEEEAKKNQAQDNYDNYKRPDMKGIKFKVQVGAFRNFDIRKYFENHKNFSGEVDPDGTMKYTLGIFSEYWEADKFKKYLREMGVKGAWVVSYKDGQRVDIKDVLEGAVN